MLRAAGFCDVVIRPFATTSDDRPLDDFAPHLGPERLVPLLSAGVLTLHEFAVAVEHWQRFRARPDSWVLLLVPRAAMEERCRELMGLVGLPAAALDPFSA